MLRRLSFVSVVLLACAVPAFVNPTLQPHDILDRYRAVGSFRVTKVDGENRLATLSLIRTIKGEDVPIELFVESPEDAVQKAGGDLGDTPFLETAPVGATVIAFISGTVRGKANSLLLYAGSEFHAAERSAPDACKVVTNLGEQMWGTFNGSADRLSELLTDAVAGAAFFPAIPTLKFQASYEVARFDLPARGLAVADFDGDGRLDIVACNEAGMRLLLQKTQGSFEDATETAGLLGATGASCSAADIDGNGTIDLLIGTHVYLQSKTGRFEQTASVAIPNVRATALLDVDGDGILDVVGAGEAGLYVFIQTAGRFEDRSESLGLRDADCGSGKVGWFVPMDLNDDGRLDLFYAADGGLVLIQQKDGRFVRLGTVGANFVGGPDRVDRFSGAGAFGAFWQRDKGSLLIPTETAMSLWSIEEEQLTDQTIFGNEINEGLTAGLGALAVDYNADGYVDVFILAWRRDQSNRVLTNRGYGSFMNPINYDAAGFPGVGFDVGATVVARGDLNGDGADDLVLANTDGSVRVLPNDAFALAARQPREHQTRQWRALSQAAVIAVQVSHPRGAVGSSITVKSGEGRVLARRWVGWDTVTGASSALSVPIAILTPGKLSVDIQLSDRTIVTHDLEISPGELLALDSRAGVGPRSKLVSSPASP